ncbi:putative DNA mismatch repair protein [Aspergillus affinis]|uniref:putative DNA mismatch repair protein n=1 Tax=Aspergillus affinis TaxID=1070780 RepID=UPI0022FEB7FB|nr:uncharacterized protein KD926_011690 [Aspergillus affinis]KAI9044720.1 hypothetical protein KD926_011690 [Aspergillus affinis]
MPITALPSSTVHAIGSTSVISDPCSIVKELLDNAIDASAASIGVEISQNTLDLIQVKDNGHGIPSADHAFVCRRTFTSKIQTLEDLRKVGAKSLGFRGQALASAAEISGGVNILTRVESELVGSSMKYGRNGELSSTQRTSHPVGTTVRITDLFKPIPVRRQTALKTCAKTLMRIKKMIQTYTMCNPSKRFSFKVLKARAENNNWVYAPQNGTLMDAVLKIAGYDVASQCVEKTWPCQEHAQGVDAEAHDLGFCLVSLLPDPKCDLTKMNNLGQYLSIDGRPISATRGIGQDIAKLYKSYIRAAASRQEGSTTTDSFLCLQIWCPEASYDVNIEPAKDDVLFEDPHEVLGLVEDLLQSTYGEKENTNGKQKKKEKQPVRDNGSFDLLLARRNEEAVSTNGNNPSRMHAAVPTSPRFPVQRPATFDSNSRSRETSDSEASLTAGSQSPVASKEGLNPWFLTSLNAPIQRINNVNLDSTGPRITKYVPGKGFREWSQSSRERNRRGSAASILPSPSASSPDSSSRSAAASPSKPASFHVPRVSASRTADQSRLSEPNEERHNNGLDRWLGRSSATMPSRASAELDEPQEPSLTQRRFEQCLNEGEPPSQLSSTADLSRHTRENSTSSATSLTRRPLDLEEMNNVRGEQAKVPIQEGWSTGLHQLSQSNVTALEDALDFERRKKEAIQMRREQIRSQSGNRNTNSPHLSRYLAARASLSQPEVPTSSREETVGDAQLNSSTEPRTLPTSATPSVLQPFDPRLYLMRRRNSHLQGTSDGSKLRRINPNKLPFETIPTGQEIHDIGLTQPIDTPYVSEEFDKLTTADLYTQDGREYEAFGPSESTPELLEAWVYRLRSLIAKRYKIEEGSVPNVQFDLSALTLP